MRILDAISPRRRPLDPPERWELQFTESEGGSYFRDQRPSFPYAPRRAEEVPPGALDALQTLCGIEDLHQVFVVPMAVRRIGLRERKVISPNGVLAIGNRAVGLWTEKPEAGIKVNAPLDQMAAIEDVTILLYGRLSFIPFAERLTIRYNTVAQRQLMPALLELRRRISGAARGPMTRDDGPGSLPFKWNYLLGTELARLDVAAPVAYRFARSPGASRHEEPRGEMLVLNPRELVYLCDPEEAVQRFGEDTYIIPRSRISDVRATKNGIEVISNSIPLAISMAPSLRSAAVGWFCRRGGDPDGLKNVL